MKDALKFLDTAEAAAFLDLEPCTLEAWRYRGGGPVFRKFGKAVRYATADLEEFVQQSARTSTTEKVAA